MNPYGQSITEALHTTTLLIYFSIVIVFYCQFATDCLHAVQMLIFYHHLLLSSVFNRPSFVFIFTLTDLLYA